MAGALDKTSAAPSFWGRVGWLRPIARFAAWWFGLFALLGPLSVCPVCGQSGCPGGAASAGILGGIMAAFISGLSRIRNFVRRHRQHRLNCTRNGSDRQKMSEHQSNGRATAFVRTYRGRE